MRALLPCAALRESSALFRRRPWATLALGLALLTSLVAVCCGLGIFAAPWFLCELFALQIGVGTGTSPRRTSGWLGAALVQMVAVSVLFAIAALSLLALGPDVVLGGIGLSAHSTGGQIAKSFGVLLFSGSLVIALSVHFEHAPAILIDRGGGVHAALLESARLVAETGAFRTWLTSVAAHGLQMAPGLAAIALSAGHSSLRGTLVWGTALLPVVALCLALGQGMVVSSYLRLRDLVTDPALVPPEAAPSKSGAFVWSLLLGCVLAGPLLVSAALAKPARPAEGSLPADAHIVLDLKPDGTLRERYLGDSALSLRVNRAGVAVVASDGGGAGQLPLPSATIARIRAAQGTGSCDRVRAAGPSRQEDACAPAFAEHLNAEDRPSLAGTFALEVTLHDGRHFLSWVDDAGVRLDDSLSRRLAALLPNWAPLALFLCLAWTTLWIARALPPQARLRRELADKNCTQTDPVHRERLKAALRRRAFLTALWLIPAALGSLTLGLWAALA